MMEYWSVAITMWHSAEKIEKPRRKHHVFKSICYLLPLSLWMQIENIFPKQFLRSIFIRGNQVQCTTYKTVWSNIWLCLLKNPKWSNNSIHINLNHYFVLAIKIWFAFQYKVKPTKVRQICVFDLICNFSL